MQKVALPVIFVCAAAAALYYVSQEEHGTGTLVLLAAVLLVGQVCATLPFIFDSAKKSRVPAAKNAPETGEKADDDSAVPAASAPVILGNQKVIQTDLRSLGEALIKRFNALNGHLSTLEKTLAAQGENPAAVPANDFADEFDDFFEKFKSELAGKFETAQSDTDEKIAAARSETLAQIEGKFALAVEKLTAELRSLGERVDELAETVETLSLADDEEEDEISDEDDSADEISGAQSDESESEEFDESAEEESFAENAAGERGNEEAENVPAETPEISETADADSDAEAGTETAEAGTETAEAGTETAEENEKPPENFPQALGATLILDAMIGIGNKPFLRGNAPGLSETAGTPMVFAEIGRWKFDFEPTNEEFTVRILRNDAENEPLGEPITLAPGQTLEIALR